MLLLIYHDTNITVFTIIYPKRVVTKCQSQIFNIKILFSEESITSISYYCIFKNVLSTTMSHSSPEIQTTIHIYYLNSSSRHCNFQELVVCFDVLPVRHFPSSPLSILRRRDCGCYILDCENNGMNHTSLKRTC